MHDIEKLLGYTFGNKGLLDRAFTHSTYSNEHRAESNERLEFLGDSVLELVVRDYIYNFYQESEGKLTEWKKQIVDKYSLCDIVDRLGLMQYLKLGGSLKNQALSIKLKSDLFESIVGAIYLDGGFDKAREFVCKNIDFESKIAFINSHNMDYKTKLQELIQKDYGVTPCYIDGEKQDNLFVRVVVINNEEIASGKGETKQLAEKEAAKNAIQILERK
jgi:ribonuclease-3